MNRNYHYCYRITNKLSGEYYIGKRSCTYKPEEDTKYWGSGRIIRENIRKHGLDNFTKEILGEFSSEEEAYHYEALLLTEEVLFDSKCLNLKRGGSGGLKGTVVMCRESTLETVRVCPEKVTVLLKQGWVLGRLQASVEKQKSGQKGRIHISNELQEDRFVSPVDLESFLKAGWHVGVSDRVRKINTENPRGKVRSEETRQRMSASRKGCLKITKDGHQKVIPPEELETYLKQGWIHKGHEQNRETRDKIAAGNRGRRRSVDTREKISNSRRGRIWISNGVSQKFILPEQVDSYVEKGWVRGRKTKGSH